MSIATPLAIFDLDNTLLGGDSDYLWGKFLGEQGVVDPEGYERENRRYYQEYVAGTLDIYDYLAFALKPLALTPLPTLHDLRRQFMQEKITPIMLPAARRLLDQHRAQGHHLIIITATHRYITEPIAEAFGVDELIATEPEMSGQRFTGRVTGTPCFREGKVIRLKAWLHDHGQNLAHSWFYSDSHNDLPLLELVTHPVAVDPDDTLAQHAEQRGWDIISLR